MEEEEDFIIEATPEQQAKQNHLLVIAVNYYGDEDISNLSNCVRDAESLIEVLTNDYFFNKEHITFLRSRHQANEQESKEAAAQEKKDKGYAFVGEATHSNIVGELKKLAVSSQKKLKDAKTENENAVPEANYIIWYSGHGIYDEVLDEGYWLPSDASKSDNATYIENSTIRTHLKAIESHHTVLISDSCYSGTLFSSGVQRDTGVPRVYKHPSRWGLTAGRKNQTVSDGELTSPFAEHMMAILARKQEIWINDLGSKIVKEMGESEAQSPMCEPLADLKGHDGGQFVFLPRMAEEIDHWNLAWRENTRKAYYAFLTRYPDGEYEEVALTALNTFAADKKPLNQEAIINSFDFLKTHTSTAFAMKHLKLFVSKKADHLKLQVLTKPAMETYKFLKEHLQDDALRYLSSFIKGGELNKDGVKLSSKTLGLLNETARETYYYLLKEAPQKAPLYLRAFVFGRTTMIWTKEAGDFFEYLKLHADKTTVQRRLSSYFVYNMKAVMFSEAELSTHAYLHKHHSTNASSYITLNPLQSKLNILSPLDKSSHTFLKEHNPVHADKYLIPFFTNRTNEMPVPLDQLAQETYLSLKKGWPDLNKEVAEHYLANVYIREKDWREVNMPVLEAFDQLAEKDVLLARHFLRAYLSEEDKERFTEQAAKAYLSIKKAYPNATYNYANAFCKTICKSTNEMGKEETAIYIFLKHRMPDVAQVFFSAVLKEKYGELNKKKYAQDNYHYLLEHLADLAIKYLASSFSAGFKDEELPERSKKVIQDYGLVWKKDKSKQTKGAIEEQLWRLHTNHSSLFSLDKLKKRIEELKKHYP